MKEVRITPQNEGDIDVGGFIDDRGRRFVALSFVGNGQRTIVTMRPELFRAYANHLSKAADMVTTEEIWGDVAG